MSSVSFSRNKTVLAVVLAVLAVPFFSCCVCAPIVAIFIPSEIDEADRLWSDGRKAEAVEIYSRKVEGGAGVANEVILERLVSFYFEQGDKEQAKHYRRIAIENGTDLTLSPDSLQASFEREKKAYEAAKQAQQEKEKQIAIRKAQEQERRIAEKNKTDLERANDFWAEGKRAEAVKIYSVEITRTKPEEIPAVFERLIIYYHENRNGEQVRKVVQIAWQADLRLKFDSDSLQAFYDEESAAYRLRSDLEKQFKDQGLLVEINNHAQMPGKKVILVRLEFRDNLTNSMIKFGAKSDVANILKAVAESGVNCGETTVFGSFPLADKYGNSEKEVVVKATYSGETIARINWSGFLLDNVYEIAESVWMHPAFRD
ncbi:hypothetical protein C5Y97_23245 [Blastopirellula marina]|uniref:Uncharacterized protein n=2 Tax=Blastopirellula marina TaxID=124 RepID=A0A2S8F988_9BACT|nr:hypothetical protein C5Y98_23235 [Blastopirellula marina]PTL41973.1 hypothetical protein C5Y97_23245 [Blastopirellula marina]